MSSREGGLLRYTGYLGRDIGPPHSPLHVQNTTTRVQATFAQGVKSRFSWPIPTLGLPQYSGSSSIKVVPMEPSLQHLYQATGTNHSFIHLLKPHIHLNNLHCIPFALPTSLQITRMPAFNSSLPTLTLLPSPLKSSPHLTPKEREIDRAALLDIAPDREALIMSGKSIEEIRQILKIRTCSNNGHWLYRTQKRVDVKLRDTTTRTSAFIRGPATKNGTPDENTPSQGTIHVVRRVLSASAISPTMGSIENRLVGSPEALVSLDIWGSPTLSTSDKLISPRPLGPTHILVAHVTSPSAVISSSVTKSGSTRRRPVVTYPQTLELPINDLLFTLNVPNLSSTITPPSFSTPSSSTLPHRLPNELPRVLMRVPHLETFPELVVYLHTKNQAELFRKVVPEWVRDLMHPLPFPAASVGTPENGSGSTAFTEDRTSAKKKRSHMQLLGIMGAVSPFSSMESLPLGFGSATRSSSPEPERSIDSIAKEIAEATSSISTPTPLHPSTSTSATDGDNPLVRTAALLDALRDNLEYVGFFGRGVWGELDLSREILIRAICWKAKVGGEVE